MNDPRAFEPVIGLEVHAQVLTKSKMFCGCSAAYAGAAPNTHVCAVCGGMPGALPVVNARAVEAAVLTGLALNCTIAPFSKFDRKNYSYPDLPKGYQISQYDLPLCHDGKIELEVDGVLHRCGIVRVHLEEDTGKSIHTSIDGEELSLVDYNRSGVPLMEIVGEPDLSSPQVARGYFTTLRQILMYLGVCDGNLQEGSMRADVNVSIRGASGEFGTKVEIKNLNSFRAVQRSLEYEIERQQLVLEEGGEIEQETRGWSEAREVTISQRTKEYAHDYRYFPEPDLPPLVLSDPYVEKIRENLAELPAARRSRFVNAFGLSEYVASVLTDEKELADFYEATVAAASTAQPTTVANWVQGELRRVLNESGGTIADLSLTPSALAALISLVDSDAISGSAGKIVLETMVESGENPEDIIERLNLTQIGNIDELQAIIDSVIADNSPIVEQYRAGKTNVIQALVGKTMKSSNGKANPQRVIELLRSQLDS